MSKTIAQTIGDSMKTLIAGNCQPGPRGSRQCWCQGQLLVMLGHYGWILPLVDVNHSASEKTDGKIYLSKRDIVGGVQLAEGDVVGFYLYVDDQGLGAEEARCVEKSCKNSFNANAAEFVPCGMNAGANEFVPAQSISMKTTAADTVPFGSKADMSTLGRLQSVFAINLAYLSDDSSDDDDTDHEDTPRVQVGKRVRRCLSPTTSTSTGLSSDDEADNLVAPAGLELPEACLGDQKFRPPPGLSLPASPCRLALGILARAGLPEEQEPHQQKKLPPWRRDSKSASSVSESEAWSPPWRRGAHDTVVAA